ncbi:hypothetical protein HDU98_005329 [Podochytrium sp. JEL0797]|nr:hypothetical protein HDU98_005329 [Podochytrium sp. JEL0797]
MNYHRYECPMGCPREGTAVANSSSDMKTHLSEDHNISNLDVLLGLVDLADRDCRSPDIILYQRERIRTPEIALMETPKERDAWGLHAKTNMALKIVRTTAFNLNIDGQRFLTDLQPTFEIKEPLEFYKIAVAYSYAWRKRYRDPSRILKKHIKVTEQEVLECYDEFVIALNK